MTFEAFKDMEDTIENRLNNSDPRNWNVDQFKKFHIDGYVVEEDGRFHNSWEFIIVDNSVFGYQSDLKSVSYCTSKQLIRIDEYDTPKILFGDYHIIALNIGEFKPKIKSVYYVGEKWVNNVLEELRCDLVLNNGETLFFVINNELKRKITAGRVLPRESFIKYLKYILSGELSE